MQPPIRRHDLWPHQLAAYHFANERPASLIGAAMGTGKSCIAIACLDNWRTRRTLILCPPSVRRVWRRELDRHSVGIQPVVLDRGTVAQRTRRAAEPAFGPVAMVLNYEAAWREPFASWAAQDWDCIVLDESHRVQKDSRIAQFVATLTAKRKICLTGTPFTQNPLSIFAQCRFLDQRLFGPELEEFRTRFDNPRAVRARMALDDLNRLLGRYGQRLDVPDRWLSGTVSSAEFQAKLRTIAYRCEATDLHLPPITHEYRSYRLSAAAAAAYESMLRSNLADLGEGHHCTGREGHPNVVRLQQITSGYLPDEGGNLHWLDHGRRRLLTELLEDGRGEPWVVFARFTPDLAAVEHCAKSLGRRYAEISGRRKDGMTDMGDMADADVVGVQQQAGGSGINLARARYAAFYSPLWSLAEYDQAVARVHRAEQTRPTTIYSLIAEDTIDRDIYASLSARRAVYRPALAAITA